MIVFHNPGELDLGGVRLMGASVKRPGSFGRFGTGLKYAIASVLRAGASLRMFVGQREYTFTTRPTEVKGETFNEVMLEKRQGGTIHAESLGFTDRLGKDWEPWMVLRELACNARDEGGDYFHTEQELPSCFKPKGGDTLFMLDWPELEASLEEIAADIFIPADLEPLEEIEGVRIFPGKGRHIYHRGVRVMELPKESAFIYDIAAPVDLTEDRTARYAFIVEEAVRRALLSSKDAGVVAAAISHKNGWEGSLKWTDETWRKPEPGLVWLEEVGRLRERHQPLSDGVVKLYLTHRAVREGRSYGGYYEGEAPPALETALSELNDLYVPLEGEDIFVASELPSGVLSMATGGRIYITPELLSARPSLIAKELLTRHLEVLSGGDHDKLLVFTVDKLISNSRVLSRDRELYEEEQQRDEEAAVPEPVSEEV